MKVWFCGSSSVAWVEGMSPGDGVGCRPYWATEELGTTYQRAHVTTNGCGWMQLVPADARMVSSSDAGLREAIIGLMTSFDWRDWPPGEEYINECITEALDELTKVQEPPPKDPRDYDP